MLKLNSENFGHIVNTRQKLKPSITYSGGPSQAYVEVTHLHWSSQAGNVVLVVPMGDEAARSENVVPTGVAALEPRKFRYQSPPSTFDIVAPNGQRVAVLALDEVDKRIELVKDQPSTHAVGTLNLRLEPENLIAGSKFLASPRKFTCVPTIGGGSPIDWGYNVFASFDSSALSVELRQCSTSLRNRNLATAVSELHEREEIVMVIPFQTPNLVATIEAPAASLEVIGRFTLRDSH
jgi:hypothetical protein